MNHTPRERPITNHAEMTDTTTSSRERQPFPAPTRTPRLLLRERDADPAPIDGAWWPWTPNLTTELHDLISALTPRLGPLARIGFAWNTISLAQRDIDRDDDVHTHGPEPDQPPDIMEAVATDGTQMTLLIIPSDTDPDRAGERMRQVLG
ncbi:MULTISPECIES: DUF5994 family protein [unclassified Nocardia]|uniref:DUF5994 family protein n=1 Tax=unclassified Nocardia TaxID=2637762 RepID=UPI00278C4F3D|nr:MULTISPECIES: DUF5994 family protein [unclassified Nocardia]